MRHLQETHSYQIIFWDHISGSASEVKENDGLIEVYGCIYKETKLFIWVASWICDRELATSNTDVYKIVKSTIISKRRLR